ncbi:MAG: tRNA adenosine(34) deaminase TadA [Candidatus Omnitrophica bacterium]|nr:tRNA adenosine(34) deaminase TadA [Candidatus Omnitrophota bacterium]
MEKDNLYMQQALKQAEYAKDEDEIPIGAVIVYQGKVIAKSYNQVERLKDPTAHAEILAITQAANYLKSKWLKKCRLYVTIEPCSMCAGALILARIDKVIFGADDPKAGAFGSKVDINNLGLNHKLKFKKGILRKECSDILKDFFKKKRKSTFNKKLTNQL